MTTDRELLEWAAKAAGIDLHVWGTKGQENFAAMNLKGRPRWNPLVDDGDAFGLVVQCGISLDRTSNRCWAWANGWELNGVCEEFYGNDPYAATRRAIVRAAASIGQQEGE